MNKKLFLKLFLFAALAILAGCGRSNRKNAVVETAANLAQQAVPAVTEVLTGSGTVAADAELIARLKAEAVKTLALGDNTFVLDAAVSRAAGEGTPLTAVSRLVETYSENIPAGVTLVKQYVVNGTSVWSADFESGTLPTSTPFRQEKVSHGGPSWGPDIAVEVFAQVHDSQTQKDYYLQRENVTIGQE
jgi:hypothetical protein